MRLQDKVAIVTGAGAGFGEGIARRFAAEGAKVVVNDLNAQDGQRVTNAIAEAGGEAMFSGADVASGDQVGGMIAEAVGAYLQIVELILEHDGHFVGIPLTEIARQLGPRVRRPERDVEVMIPRQTLFDHMAKRVANDAAQGSLNHTIVSHSVVTHPESLIPSQQCGKAPVGLAGGTRRRWGVLLLGAPSPTRKG